jgi:hypothetical protein
MANGETFSDEIFQQISINRSYAQAAIADNNEYLHDIKEYIQHYDIAMVVPSLTITPPSPVVIDPTLVGEIPDVPTDYPTLPDAPTTSDFAFPSAPVYTMPTVPTLSDIVIPDFIEGVISPLTTQMPVSNIEMPALTQIDSGGQAVEDELVQAAKAKLVSNIVNGGTMLNPLIEASIWNRDRERREQALQDSVDKLTAQWAKLGWSIPDGLLAGSLIAVNNEYMNKDLDVSRDIAIKQAELEQTGMFKSLELANQLEGILIESFNDYAKRVFEVSKATVDVTVQILKSRIDLYNMNLQAFKTDVETYKIAIEAELARSEVYKARMEGIKTLAMVDSSRVQVYTAQLGAIAQQVEVFKATVESVGLMYSAEKQKIEAYKARVEAYTSAVDGVTKRYIGEVEGFKGLVQAYVASADSQTRIEELELKTQIARVDATLKSWEIQLQVIIEETKVQLSGLETIAKTTSNLAAGAMAAGHTAMSLSGASALEGIS